MCGGVRAAKRSTRRTPAHRAVLRQRALHAVGRGRQPQLHLLQLSSVPGGLVVVAVFFCVTYNLWWCGGGGYGGGVWGMVVIVVAVMVQEWVWHGRCGAAALQRCCVLPHRQQRLRPPPLPATPICSGASSPPGSVGSS